jgi:hypothetical protein
MAVSVTEISIIIGRIAVKRTDILLRAVGDPGGWGKVHNVMYSSPSIIRVVKSRRMRWVGHLARMGEKRNAYRTLVGKPEGKRPLGRPRRRWVDSIKMDLREIGWDGVDWIAMTQDRGQWRDLVNTVLNLRVP